MSDLTAPLSVFDGIRVRVRGFARQHAHALVLACTLTAALIVSLVPAAGATRCIMVEQQTLGTQGALSLSIALTALAWWVHKPALRFIAARRRNQSSTPAD